MSKLILPSNQLIVPSRRGFIKGTATAIAGLFVAPAIVPAANLMQIHSPTNKLIVAFQISPWAEKYPSFLNLTDYTEASFRAWEAVHFSNIYSLVRAGEIIPKNEGMIGGRPWAGHGDTELERQLDLKCQQALRKKWVTEDINRYFNDEVYREKCDRGKAEWSKVLQKAAGTEGSDGTMIEASYKRR